MKETKFRVWNKKEKVMDYSLSLVFLKQDGLVGICYPNILFEEQPELIDLELNQYTGIKDMNEKEIYEGDILSCKCRKIDYNKNPPLEGYRYQNSVIEWWVSICNMGYRLRNGSGKTIMVKPSMLQTMEVEVIGNIYENPELLEEQK